MHKPMMDTPTRLPEADSPTRTGASHATEQIDPDATKPFEGQETQSGGTATHQPPTPTPASTSPSGGEDAFRPGDLVAGRYKVERFIARGGMGEVYQAQDTTLGGSVALKTIRARVASDQRAIERFKREILLARQVTHPNVSRIFDIERHAPSTTQPATLFLTMELLPGTTLRQHIREHGKLSTAQALPILQQMARGLAAAHKAGIVHRDFKSANVMLVPSPQGSTRAVVTDFGLARLDSHQPEEPQPPPEPQQPPPHQDENPFASLTGSGSVVGTPAYMAPEQVLGQKATAAADIYALGVVLFEMVTGALPFASASSMSTATERLKRKAPSPRELVAELDPAWERVILKCMERNPSERYQSVEELLEALTPPQTPIVQMLPPPRSRMVAAAALLAVLLVSSAFIVSRTLSPPARRSIAVLGFQNQASPQDAWLSTALSEMLRPELAASPSLRLIQPETVARVKTELGLPEAASYSKDALQKLKLNLGAELLVVGSYRRQGSRLLWQVALQNSATGERLEPFDLDSPESELFPMVSEAGERLRAKLGAAARLSTQELDALQAARPANQQALRLYAQGLDKLQSFENQEAARLFERAIAEDPAFAAAQMGSSKAQGLLGNDPAAQEHAAKAFELSKKLPREEALWIEVRSYETNSQRDKAIQLLASLFLIDPENFDYGLRLAQNQVYVGKNKEALDTLEQLKGLPPPMNGSPWIPLTETDVQGSLGDIPKMKAAAQRAYAAARARGLRMLESEALQAESLAERYSGNYRLSLEKSEKAKQITEALGDSTNTGRILAMMAANHALLGELQTSETLFLQARELFERLGFQAELASISHSLANVSIQLGKLKDAESVLPGLISLSQKLGFVEFQGYNEVLLGWALRHEGRLEESEAHLKQALDLLEKPGNTVGIAWAQWHMGELMALRGRREEARRLLQRSFELRDQGGLAVFAAQSRLALAELDLAENLLKEAEQGARAAMAEFEKAQSVRDQAWASLALAEILLVQGADSEVQRIWPRTLQQASESQCLEIRLRGTLLKSKLFEKGFLDARGGLTEELQLALRQASDAGLAELRLRLDLELARLDLAGEKAEEGKQRVDAIVREATGLGLESVASAARAAMPAP